MLITEAAEPEINANFHLRIVSAHCVFTFNLYQIDRCVLEDMSWRQLPLNITFPMSFQLTISIMVPIKHKGHGVHGPSLCIIVVVQHLHISVKRNICSP